MRIKVLAAIAFLALIGQTPSANAGNVTALQSFSGGTLFTAGSDQIYAWEFDLLETVVVETLGVFDNSGDGLVDAHEVGIFRSSDQELMMAATIDAGSGFLENDFRYVPIRSRFLDPGRYVIAMTMPELTGDLQSLQNTSVTTAPQVVYVGNRFGDGSTLVFPVEFVPIFEFGMFGPNFQFTTVVPEPSTVLSMGIGGIFLVGLIRNRRKSA